MAAFPAALVAEWAGAVWGELRRLVLIPNPADEDSLVPLAHNALRLVAAKVVQVPHPRPLPHIFPPNGMRGLRPSRTSTARRPYSRSFWKVFLTKTK